jgi:predicted RNase H-like nuclease (RuvC/YqgF family)
LPELRDFIELGVFAWGVILWGLSKREKRTDEEKQSVKQAFVRTESNLNEKLALQRDDLKYLKLAVSDLQQAVAALKAQVDDLRDSAKVTNVKVDESAHNVERMIGTWQKKLDETFGKVILK